jgi:dsRNA-specific ribonuclease
MQWEEFQEKTLKDVKLENLKFYILNEKNRLITKDFLKGMFEKLGIKYYVNDIKLFEIAMTHESYIEKDFTKLQEFKTIYEHINVLNGETLIPISNSNMAIPLQKTSYERLECFGDALLRLIITDYLFNRYNEAGPGIISDARSRIENRSSFSNVTKKTGLCKYILLGRNQEHLHAREKSGKIQCDAFEAFICALYLDVSNISYDDIGNNINIMNLDRGKAYQFCYKLVKRMIEEYIDLSDIFNNDTNYKKILLNYYQKMNWGTPVYNLKDVKEDPNNAINKRFQFYLKDNNNNIISESSYETSKKNAEQKCAKIAIEKLNKNKNGNEYEDEILDTKEKMKIINFQ